MRHSCEMKTWAFQSNLCTAPHTCGWRPQANLMHVSFLQVRTKPSSSMVINIGFAEFFCAVDVRAGSLQVLHACALNGRSRPFPDSSAKIGAATIAPSSAVSLTKPSAASSARFTNCELWRAVDIRIRRSFGDCKRMGCPYWKLQLVTPLCGSWLPLSCSFFTTPILK